MAIRIISKNKKILLRAEKECIKGIFNKIIIFEVLIKAVDSVVHKNWQE